MSNLYIDVTEPPYNAGTGSDDTSAISAAITAAAGKKRVLFPYPSYGAYLIQSGPIIISQDNTVLEAATNGVILSAGGVDKTLIQIQAAEVQLENFLIQGKGTPYGLLETSFGATQPTVAIGNGAAAFDCQMRSVTIQGGSICLTHSGAELKLYDFHAAFAYGQALLYCYGDPSGLGAGSIIGHGVFLDNNWDPRLGGGPPSGITSVTNWSSTLPVTYQQLILHPSGYYLQCSQAGTTGTSAPVLKNYRAPISDGSAVWSLACPQNLAALQLDSGNREVYIDMIDMTGAAFNGLATTNTVTGGVEPQFIRLTKPTAGLMISHALNLKSGSYMTLTDCEVGSGFLSSANGIITQSQWSGPLHVKGGYVDGTSWGILNAAGADTKVIGVELSGNNSGGFYSNVGKFTLAENTLAGPASAYIDSGASDYVCVNNCSPSAAVVTDLGSAPKTVNGNI